ncbi:isopenicillin N synthase family dioxygenase [Aquabacterium humicola]|uniref:isopenicillin N synthase family dioxygenase n=1 Tax=Aquabacterium humicola TaxID=3237377 RepID=UPI002543A32B|nr:2-oxoglutarate and iron-dependent oxygenase domain-containing protein [Rubrivivax pictus]
MPAASTTLSLVDLRAPDAEAARRIGEACRAQGFFYLVGHGLDEARAQRLEALSHRFFALPDELKQQWSMDKGGRAWRGWFPLGGELTSGRPDWKEGLYLGTELPDDDPRVRAGEPLHGRNLLPGDDVLPGFRDTVLDYIADVTALGHRVMALIALSLDLPADYFAARYTADPLVLFRIFQYPSRPVPDGLDVRDGVGEHTDYGLLTLLRQDTVGGLQVRTPGGWIDAPPLAGSLVCNIGDMLDRMTGGLYHSTPHRVKLNASGHHRLSFPLFFDPNMAARIEPIRSAATDDHATRWDGASVHAFDGTYGDYVLAKVGKVFPQLKQAVLPTRSA